MESLSVDLFSEPPDDFPEREVKLSLIHNSFWYVTVKLNA